MEYRGSTVLRALQPGAVLQPALAGTHPWTDIRQAGSRIRDRPETYPKSLNLGST
jgi:hypothetical protein